MESLVEESVKEGAEIVTGGKRVHNNGFFCSPTVLKNISPKMWVASEEVFGPIAPVIVVEDDNNAMKIANDTKYGLGASIWTQDLDKAEKLSRAIEMEVSQIVDLEGNYLDMEC